MLRCLCRVLCGHGAAKHLDHENECFYLYVDGSYEPAAEDSLEKCGWGLHVVRENLVQEQFCSTIFCGFRA